jgi:serine/threonine protein kinase
VADPKPFSRDGPDRDFLAPAQRPDELGRLGPYRVLKVLGHGGMGMVFLADDPHLKRAVALKVMLPHVGQAPAARERFLREARAAAALEHDHIVPVYQIGVDRGVTFIAMPFLKGMNLEDYLKKKGDLAVPQILRIGREVAKGLAAAHDKGLVHRDIKPANLWLDANAKGRIKILDFGLARPAHVDEQLTQVGTILGTPAYMSPEQAAGQPVGPASDLFSLGAVLYRLCTGRKPFSGPNTYAILTALATEQPPPVRDRNPAVTPAFAGLIMQLLEKDPARRPASAKQVAETIYAIERERLLEKLHREAAPGLQTVGGSHAVSLNPDESIDSQFHFDDVSLAPAGAKRRTGRSLGPWPAAGGAALAAALVAGILLLGRRADERPVAKAGSPPEPRLGSDSVKPLGSNPAHALMAVQPASARPAEGQWEHLFNGTDLTGWRVSFDREQVGQPFTVGTVDGEAAIQTTGADADLSVAETPTRNRSFENYHLRWQYKLHSGQPAAAHLEFHFTGTSVCYLSLDKPGRIHRYSREVRRTWDEAVWHAGRRQIIRSDVPSGAPFPYTPPAGVTDGWHAAELYCVGATAVPVLDGQVLGAITNIRDIGTDNQARPITRGAIGLRALSGVVSFRRIEMRPIADIPKEIKAKVRARPAEGQWEHLFNGTDLTGWRLDYNPRQAGEPFRVATADGEPAIQTTGIGAAISIAESQSRIRSFENYHLRIRYKLQSGQSTAALQFHNNGSRCYLMLHKPVKISWYNETGRRTWDEAVWDAGQWRKVGPDVSRDTVFPFTSLAGFADAWHDIDLYCVGATAVFVLDGEVLGAITNIRNVGKDGESSAITKGYVGIVAWAGVVSFRTFNVRPIADIPEEIKAQVRSREGWTPLFNGTDLTGWRVTYDPDRVGTPFRVGTVDGEPAIQTTGANALLTATATPSENWRSENYHLRWQYKLQPGQPSTASLEFHSISVSGCYFDLDKPGSVRGYCHQGRRTWDEAVWDAGRWRKVRSDVSQETVFQHTPRAGRTNGWHKAELYCVGATAVPVLDGQVLGAITNIRNMGKDGETRMITRGTIGLRAWSGVVSFRRIEVRPIADIPEEIKAKVRATDR